MFRGFYTSPARGLLETNEPNEHPPKVEMAVPEDERVGAQVGYLPDDVDRFYRDAQRVLDAGVPDAAAVQLRKTLEAAAAHFGINDGPLVARIEKLIQEGLITKRGSARFWTTFGSSEPVQVEQNVEGGMRASTFEVAR